MTRRLVLLAALLAPGCAEVPRLPVSTPQSGAEQAVATPGPIKFIEDDLPAATARARAEGKALFIDAWAPWCHTCLSMQAYVLNDPSLRPLAERVVFAAIDTDKPSSAAFLERHAVKAWPTFFVLDPAQDAVLGYWSGSGSVEEIRGLIAESLASVLFKMGKLPEAQAAIERAIAHAYGPRRLRYLKLRAQVQAKRGDAAGELATLRAEVNGYEALPPGQASPESLADARARLTEAEARAPR